jgi:hypothetical protein
MILFKSNTYHNKKNLYFNNLFKVNNNNDLKALNETDWTPHLFDGPRLKENWRGTNCLVVDIDNGITIEQFLHKFRRYKVFVCSSRNHCKEKNGIICERFHALLDFPRFGGQPIKPLC